MKRTITFFSACIALLFLPAFVVAQHAKPHHALQKVFNAQKQLIGTAHKAAAVTLSLDSVYLNDISNGIKEKNWKYVYNYDGANGNCLEEYEYEWNGFTWDMANKYTYAYDANTNLTEETYYEWNGTMWEPDWRYLYVYNSNNELIEEIDEGWSSNAWQPYWRTTYTYGSPGMLDEEMMYSWNGSSWDAIQKEVYTYDSFGVLLEKLLSSWTGTAWYTNEKAIYSYNSQGLLSIRMIYEWSGSVWEKDDSTAYSYDSNGYLDEETSVYWTGSMWHMNDRITRVNDANGNMLEEIYAYWGSSNNWVNDEKTEGEYDLAYDNTNIAAPDWFSEEFYNKLDYYAHYYWDNAVWEKEEDIDLFYSNFIDVEEMTRATFSAYPVPVTNRLFIRAGEKGNATLYDLTGKQLASWSLERGEQSVDFSAYPPGLYFLHVQGKGVIRVTKQ